MGRDVGGDAKSNTREHAQNEHEPTCLSLGCLHTAHKGLLRDMHLSRHRTFAFFFKGVMILRAIMAKEDEFDLATFCTTPVFTPGLIDQLPRLNGSRMFDVRHAALARMVSMTDR